jgi:hypothetical protein
MDPFAAAAQAQANDGTSWWFKWLIKGAAVLMGFIAIILGIVTAISFSGSCMAAGLILM